MFVKLKNEIKRRVVLETSSYRLELHRGIYTAVPTSKDIMPESLVRIGGGVGEGWRMVIPRRIIEQGNKDDILNYIVRKLKIEAIQQKENTL